MKIKIEKKLKRFLKQHKAYKRFRKCVHEQNNVWIILKQENLAHYKGKKLLCNSILSAFVINDISSDQQEIDFWWNLNSEWNKYISSENT